MPVQRTWKSLLTWYEREKRDLPWRRTRDPYCIWVSEVMLHQTRVETVLPYYERFLKRFPDVGTLARARLQSVLKVWEGLGYYGRARNLHEAAKVVAQEHGGLLPEDPKALARLPGIGAYSVGAILSIAYGLPLPAIDGNVRRVLSRLFGVDTNPADPATRKQIEGLARQLVSSGRPKRPGDVNQALMDLGARVCLPRNPRCQRCPVQLDCVARLEGKVHAISGSLAKPIPRAVAFSCLLARRNEGRILLAQNPPTGLFGGLWELPGGECAASLSPAEALPGLLSERAGLQVKIGKLAGTFTATLTHRRIAYHVYEAETVRKRRPPPAYQQIRWVEPQSLENLPLSKTQQEILLTFLSR